eukprot:TRINITY_DN874_c0_g1_i1.p1 TRINITY_DN874_c0_g1~~TRINITY_DN874_c0_g1_i1.p1  ORF type:complete len:733 (+),score=187.36 TRINITY_DN874_c0_g1_i1:91-2289(+)
MAENDGDRAFSNVDADGEWKNRKISLLGVVRSFVSQLKPGQDLTRVSLPAVLLHPYSILEVVGFRDLVSFDPLCRMNSETDPLERFLCVLRWFFGTVQNETFHKKPYNPILGEIHQCWTESPQFGRTTYIAEQVSHHPPIAAIHVRNEQEDITNSTNVTFGVKFGGNYVSIVTEGPATLNIGKWKEQYEVAKRTPDMVVRNVVWGTKRIFWSGDVSVSCAKTGYGASFTFKESGNDNVVTGEITHNDETLFSLKGKCGGEIWLESTRNSEKKLLVDIAAFLRKKPHIYYHLWRDIDSYDSLSVWKDVSRYIIDNDMDRADEEKKKIEQDQRARINERKASGLEYQAKHFIGTEAGWIYKNDKTNVKKDLSDNELSDSDSEEEPKKVLQTPIHEEYPHPEEELIVDKRPLSPNESKQPSKLTKRNVNRTSSIGMRSDSENDLLAAVNRRHTSPPMARLPKSTSLNMTSSSDLSIDNPNVLKGWMKMRNSMKIWINRFFVLRPGKMVYYKDEKEMARDRCIGILKLQDCKIKMRDSNKDSYSFKIYHVTKMPIYHKFGLRGETLKMAMIPGKMVSWNYCILRVANEQDRKIWITNINQQIEYANTHQPTQIHSTLDSYYREGYDYSDEDVQFEKAAEFDEVDEIDSTNESFQRSLMESLLEQQKSAVKSVHKRTLKEMEEWKREIDLKLVAMEKKIITNVNKAPTHAPSKNQLSLTYIQLMIVLLLWFFIARLF